jgi:hypothetical protein
MTREPKEIIIDMVEKLNTYFFMDVHKEDPCGDIKFKFKNDMQILISEIAICNNVEINLNKDKNNIDLI